MTVVRKNTPWSFPIRYADGEYTDKCRFGVERNMELDPPVQVPTSPDCVCPPSSEDPKVAGVGSNTCRHCHWFIGVLDEAVICSHPITLTGE